MTIVEARPEGSRPISPLTSSGRAGSTPPPPLRAPKKSKVPVIVALAAILAVGGVLTSHYVGVSATVDGTVVTATAQMDSFDVRIPLNGEMKASRNVEIRNQVEGQTTIVS